MKLRRLLFLLAISITAVDHTAVAQGLTEVRKHFVAKEDEKTVLSATEIVRMTPEHDTNVVALKTDRDTLLLLSRERDYRNQDAVYEIRDPERKSFVRSSIQFPFAARTRDETIAEARAKPGASGALKLTIETPGIVLSMAEGDWKDREKVRNWRTQIRESLDSVFLESLERLRTVLREDPRLQAFHDTLLDYVFHGGHCEEDSMRVSFESASPDCAFDAAAGYPCRDNQKERVDKAAKEKRQLEVY